FSSFEHCIDSMCRINCTDQNSMRMILTICDNIKQGMNSIAEVNIRSSSFRIHDLGSFSSSSSVSMRSTINNSCICFCFCDDAAGKCSVKTCEQIFSQQLFGNLDNIGTGVEGLGKFHKILNNK